MNKKQKDNQAAQDFINKISTLIKRTKEMKEIECPRSIEQRKEASNSAREWCLVEMGKKAKGELFREFCNGVGDVETDFHYLAVAGRLQLLGIENDEQSKWLAKASLAVNIHLEKIAKSFILFMQGSTLLERMPSLIELAKTRQEQILDDTPKKPQTKAEDCVCLCTEGEDCFCDCPDCGSINLDAEEFESETVSLHEDLMNASSALNFLRQHVIDAENQQLMQEIVKIKEFLNQVDKQIFSCPFLVWEMSEMGQWEYYEQEPDKDEFWFLHPREENMFGGNYFPPLLEAELIAAHPLKRIPSQLQEVWDKCLEEKEFYDYVSCICEDA